MENVTRIISEAFRRARLEIPNFKSIMDDDLPLFDVSGAVLDSLNLISFIFILEEVYLKETGYKIKVTTEDLLNTNEAPFRNVRGLRNFLAKKIAA